MVTVIIEWLLNVDVEVAAEGMYWEAGGEE